MTSWKLLVAASLVSACTGLSNTSTSGEMGGVGVGGQGDGSELEETVALSANYAMTNEFAIPAGSLAPENVYELLSDLSNDPGAALVALAEAAGVPAADRLFRALPDSLSSRIEDWMTDAIASEGLEDLRVVMELSQFVLANAEVASTLAIDTDTGTATHTLSSIAFAIGGEVVEEEIPQVPSLPGAGHAQLGVETIREADGTYLFMGEHRFGLLFGTAAFRAFESKLVSDYGMNLRELLGETIDCVSVAQEVSDQCVLGVCVGHEAELIGLCEGALDRAADEVREQFLSLDTELLVLEAGQARMEASAFGSLLRDGRWDARADFGVGLRSVPARFSADSF